MIIFKDRASAGIMLSARLHKNKARKDTVVLGIPRGGVVLGYEIAKVLKLPLDVVITRKIGDPHQRELALGAVDPDGSVVWNERLIEELGLRLEDLGLEVQRQKEEIRRREELYRQGKTALEVREKVVLLVDDGVATGETMLSAVKFLQKRGAKKIVAAIPVGAQDAISKVASLGAETEVLFPIPTRDFRPVSSYYQEFKEVGDQEVVELLR